MNSDRAKDENTFAALNRLLDLAEADRDELRAACAAYRIAIQEYALSDPPNLEELEAFWMTETDGRAFLAQHKRMKAALTTIRDNAGHMTVYNIIIAARAALQESEGDELCPDL